MRWEPGRVVVRRNWRGGRITMVNVTVVAADDDRGLRLWNPVGAPWSRIVAADGRTHHDGTLDQLGDDAALQSFTWRDYHVLFWLPEGEAFSVWWFWHAASGRFEGWKVDLQDPVVRWDDGRLAGVDTADHALDVMVEPDLVWAWKDEAEFADKPGIRSTGVSRRRRRSAPSGVAWPT